MKKKIIDALKILTPKQRHKFYDLCNGKFNGHKLTKQPYVHMELIDVNNTVVCFDGFRNEMYLLEVQ